MPQRIARHIVAYLEQLERTQGLHITLHPMGGALQPYLPILNPYNIHHNPYCLLVKTSAAAWNRCVARQGRVCTACRDEAVFGMCYAGVEEFVFPIHPGGDEGFVSVSGYATHPERALPRIRAVAAEYVLDHGELLRTHRAALRTAAPTLPDLEPWIAPLCDMLRLLRQLSPYEPQRPASDEDALYGHLVSILSRNYAEPIHVAELAALCHCSVSTISHCFKRRSGKSIREYVNGMRMEAAERLLLGTDLNVQQIAGLVGMADANYFIHRFKKYNGLPPARFRRMNERK